MNIEKKKKLIVLNNEYTEKMEGEENYLFSIIR